MTEVASEIRARLKAPWFLRLLRPRLYSSKELLIRATTLVCDTAPPAPIQDLRVETEDFLFTSSIRVEGAERSDPLFSGFFKRSHVRAFKTTFDVIQSAQGAMQVVEGVETFFAQDSYLSQSEASPVLERLRSVPIAPSQGRQSEWVPAEIKACSDRIAFLIEDFSGRLKKKNNDFVEEERRRLQPLFSSLEKHPLTPRQEEAVIRNEDANLIIAGAGTGKTACVVARIAYLLEKNLAAPAEILVLAYAKKAQLELEERIKEAGLPPVEVRTFHSVGLRICGQATDKMPSLSTLAEDEHRMGEFIQTVLTEALRDPKRRSRLIDFLFFYRNEIVEEWQYKSQEDYLRKISSADLRTLNGERVRSYQELKIANWLALHGIEYVYESPFAHETATAEHRQYKPDFYLPAYDLYLEHFGIDENGETAPWISSEQYRADMAWKIAIHETHGTKLIQTFSHQHQNDTWERNLKEALLSHEVEIEELSTAEALIEALNAQGAQSTLARFLKQYLDLMKASGATLQSLQEAAAREPAARRIRARAFLPVLELVSEAYEASLAESNEIDFGSMVNLATDHVEAKTYRSPFTQIIVDEFQDISRGRAALLQALTQARNDVRILCVGDDWQSIFRFAGSDVGLMANFEEHFGYTAKTSLDVTFRYPAKLLTAAERFISQNPIQIKKEIRSHQASQEKPIELCFVDGGAKTQAENTTLLDHLEHIRNQIQQNTLSGDSSVLFLGRYRHSRDQLPRDYMQPAPGWKPEFQTVHSAKGLEADYVVLLSADQGRYGFPTEIVDDPLLQLVLGNADDFPNAEERRLFYVALTRAKKKVFILSSASNASAFTQELLADEYEHEVALSGASFERADCPDCGARLLPRDGKFGRFWSCEFFPRCEGKLRSCVTCFSGAVVHKEETWRCNRVPCSKLYELCRRPGCPGYESPKSGKFGDFYGCSEYPDCTQTRKIIARD
jgi:DNA helicase-4